MLLAEIPQGTTIYKRTPLLLYKVTEVCIGFSKLLNKAGFTYNVLHNQDDWKIFQKNDTVLQNIP
jgi:hypothetical protein